MSEQIKEETDKRNKQIKEKINSVIKMKKKPAPPSALSNITYFHFIKNSRNMTDKKDGK